MNCDNEIFTFCSVYTSSHLFYYAVSTEEYSALAPLHHLFSVNNMFSEGWSRAVLLPPKKCWTVYGAFKGTQDFLGPSVFRRMKNSSSCIALIFVLFLCQPGSSQQPLRRLFVFFSNWRRRREDMSAGHTMGLAYHCILQHLEVEPMRSFCLLIVVRHSILFCHPG